MAYKIKNKKSLELKDNQSICTDCGRRINDDKETKWSKDAEPYCKKCFIKI